MSVSRLLLAGLFCLAMAGGWAAETVIKFSHGDSPDSPRGRAASYFKQQAAQLSGGKLRVEVYPADQPFREGEAMEALQINALQMLAPSFGKLSSLGLREFELFDLPYLFSDTAMLHRLTDGPLARQLQGGLQERGLLGLAYWDGGFRHFSARRPLQRLEDFTGLRLRVPPSRVLSAQIAALGGQPVQTSQAELHGALASGLIDGSDSTASQFLAMQLDTVQPYLCLSAHAYQGYLVLVSRRFWNSLPEGQRQQLELALRRATVLQRQLAEAENQAALARIRAEGRTAVFQPDAAERQRWRRASAGLYRQFGSSVGPALLEAVQRLGSEAPPP